jgi:hypothetical protein
MSKKQLLLILSPMLYFFILAGSYTLLYNMYLNKEIPITKIQENAFSFQGKKIVTSGYMIWRATYEKTTVFKLSDTPRIPLSAVPGSDIDIVLTNDFLLNTGIVQATISTDIQSVIKRYGQFDGAYVRIKGQSGTKDCFRVCLKDPSIEVLTPWQGNENITIVPLPELAGGFTHFNNKTVIVDGYLSKQPDVHWACYAAAPNEVCKRLLVSYALTTEVSTWENIHGEGVYAFVDNDAKVYQTLREDKDSFYEGIPVRVIGKVDYRYGALALWVEDVVPIPSRLH